jgi:hypothetical protein
VYVDAHECAVVEQTWTMLIDLLPKLPQLKAVCYECEGVSDEQSILNTLARLRALVCQYSNHSALVAVVKGDKA